MDRLAKIPPGGEETDESHIVRLRISVGGIVQGVGFRPFIYRLAQRFGITGYVLNNPEGVMIEAEGPLAGVSGLLSAIGAEAPPQARIDTLSAHFLNTVGDQAFAIRDSSYSAERTVLISPDIATCEDCLRELRDNDDRRYRYPFTNCTNCGPRYTIIRDIPYDRANTTMNIFPMCPECGREYEDPLNRRFHAEPNACPVCGPAVVLRDQAGSVVAVDDPVAAARKALRAGKIVAVKGLGGFHLAVDATDDDAVRRLRRRKQREEKPLAVMAMDIGAIRTFAVVGDEEERVLMNPSRPIVLLRKQAGSALADSVAPGNRNIGVMLPYTPLHHLLLEGDLPVVVMTSGNLSEEPIAIDMDDAVGRLGAVADIYLDHDREILSRCDDSVVRVVNDEMLFLRRSRGWVPLPVGLDGDPPTILACGAHLKNTVAVTRGSQVFLSQHIGDLENLPAFEFFRSSIELLGRIVRVEPEVVAYDLHPDYLSTRFALDLPVATRIGVQHHHAHIASCLGEAGIDGPVIGLALDGTGYGPDGTVWGCEILQATRRAYERLGHLEQVAMPGGEVAVKRPWRMALSHLVNAFGDGLGNLDLVGLLGQGSSEIETVLSMLNRGVNCPITSSCGRLFDAVSSLCGVRDKVTYEGQAAIELEMTIDEAETGTYGVEIEECKGSLVIAAGALIRAIVEDLRAGVGRGTVGAKFHNWVVKSLVETAREVRRRNGLDIVALSGGCFQNEILLRRTYAALEAEDFKVIINRRVPANDGGISFGQVVVAAAGAVDNKQ
jgi:hydrogenase maturation protein HypF